MRPQVTLTYAQSLNGCIAARPGERLMLSGPESMHMTHGLRATHDGILVGIGTVLADNPRLTVRLVEGPHPQPIVVDSQLRCPLGCHLIQSPARPLWVCTTPQASLERQQALQQAGVRVIRVPADSEGRVDLPQALAALSQAGLGTLMIEGGAGMITASLRHRLADRLVLTIAPRIVSGVSAIAQQDFNGPTLHHVVQRQLGDDLIIEADLTWGA